MITVKLYPVGMKEIALACDLFGAARLEVHSWPLPVYIHELTEEEYNFCVEFFKELGVTVEKVRK
jgi:hypothetical protein